MQLPWLEQRDDRESLRGHLLGVTNERMLREMAEALEALSAVIPVLLVLEDPGADHHRASAGSPEGTPHWRREIRHALQSFAKVLDPKRTPKFFLHWYWRMNAQLGLSSVWLASGDLRKARLEADRFLQSALSTAEPNLQALAWRWGHESDGREGLEGRRGEDREGPRVLHRSRYPRRRGAFTPPGRHVPTGKE